MSEDFDAARKRLEESPCWHAEDVRLLLDEVRRLRAAIRPIAAAIVDAGPRLPDDKSVELTLTPKEADRIVKVAGMESNRATLRGEGEK